MTDRDTKPLDSTDAAQWAGEFMRLFGSRRDEIDESLMLGWFANAIMKGYDTARNKYEARARADDGPCLCLSTAMNGACFQCGKQTLTPTAP